MVLRADLPIAPIAVSNPEERENRHALYCALTGCRIDPTQGDAPPAGTCIAVIVFERGETLPISRDTLLGRSPYVDRDVLANARDAVIVADEKDAVSRRHLLLRVRNWNIEVLDLGSRNGTLLKPGTGDWLQLVPGVPYPITDGQTLCMGSRLLTVHFTGRHRESSPTQSGGGTRQSLRQSTTTSRSIGKRA